MTADGDLRIARTPAPIRTQVVGKLRQAIVSRQFQPGRRLVERELMELTGVSRTSIREALRELAAEGLVTSIPNKGTVVTAISEREAAELYQVRAELEALAGRLFVEQASDRHRQGLRAAFGRLEKAAARRADIVGPRREFFDTLFDGAGNETLGSIVSGLQARSGVLRSQSLSATGRAAEIVEELRAIVDAVDQGDATAAGAACRHYVEQARSHGMAQLRADIATSSDS